MADDTFTLQEAADELGVHYMTAYRYVRLGLLDAVKRGGTWQVERAAIDEFRSGTDRSPVERGERAPWAERLESRLVEGDAAGAWAVVDKAMSSGMALDAIYVDLLTPAMVNIGDRWDAGELDVAVEHRASGIATRIVGQIGPRFARRGRARGLIVVTSPPGELHALPVAMLSDLLRFEGWEVTDLGANLPAASLVSLLEGTPDAVAVGLSVSSKQNLQAAAGVCRSVRACRPGVLIVVGGGAVAGPADAAALGADAVASTSQEMSRLVETHVTRARATSAPVPHRQS